MSRVLVVEDDPLVAKLLRFVLTRAGHEVVHAGTGPEGVQRFETDRPALIVLDMRLPGMDGFGVLAHVRRAGPRPPVLMLTADRGLRERALRAGADEHMQKPFDVAAFTACVGRLIADD